MAPAPAPRKRFDLASPGPKEYAIIGGSVLAVALAYFWWKKRQAAASAAASPSTDSSTGSSAPSTPTGLNTSQFLSWIHDHNSSSTTTTAPVSSTTSSSTGSGGSIPVPAVVGERANFAIGELESSGLSWSSSTSRNPQKTYTVSAQNPSAGTLVAPGSKVALTFKMQQAA
jgi:PASTA domain